MRRLVRAVTTFLAAALIVAAGLTVSTVWLNGSLDARDALAIAADLWVGSAMLLAVPILACAALARVCQKPLAPSDGCRFAIVGLFALFWFTRLEPAHQLVSIRPHLSRWGTFELLAIGAAAATAVLWPARAAHGFRRFAATGLILTVASMALAAGARAIEPSPSRDEAIAPLVARADSSTGPGARSRRVLVVGIDGLEWRTLAWMIAHNRMPTLKRLLDEGRFYQQDNERLGSSAAIWTAMYSGQPAHANRIDDFVKWRFRGTGHDANFLPRVGMHGVFFLDEFLKRTAALGLWDAVPVETSDSPPPAVWSIASASGKRVGVVAPMPYSTPPERLNGFFVDADDDRHAGVFYGDGRPPDDIENSPAPDDFGELRELAFSAAALFRRERPDLGVFYTHLVDSTQHEFWDYALERRFFGGDPSPVLDDRFDATPIRRAYDTADEALSILIEGFGSDATVVVVSDHGWRYDDYEHFRSPNGVLVLSPFPARGYGGVAGVFGVAPTILALLGVPSDASMRDPIAPVAGTRTAELYAMTIKREFLTPLRPDDDWQRRLRSLGYLSGGKPRITRAP